jgi:hypothetical protein
MLRRYLPKMSPNSACHHTVLLAHNEQARDGPNAMVNGSITYLTLGGRSVTDVRKVNEIVQVVTLVREKCIKRAVRTGQPHCH